MIGLLATQRGIQHLFALADQFLLPRGELLVQRQIKIEKAFGQMLRRTKIWGWRIDLKTAQLGLGIGDIGWHERAPSDSRLEHRC